MKQSSKKNSEKETPLPPSDLAKLGLLSLNQHIKEAAAKGETDAAQSSEYEVSEKNYEAALIREDDVVRRRRSHRTYRRKICRFCIEKVDFIDYKDVKLLQSYIPEHGKILPRRISGACAAHQRMLSEAIKRARQIAVQPYAADQKKT